MARSGFASIAQDIVTDQFRHRVAVSLFVVLACFTLLSFRFFYLQVIKHEYYSARSEENRISFMPLVPNRGIVADRNGVVLARNDSVFILEVAPGKVTDLDRTITALAGVVAIEAKDIKRFKRLLEESRGAESVPIRRRLSDDEVARFVANRYRFPGVELKARLFRQYPMGKLASHALGYLGRVTESDEGWVERNEQTANYNGTEHVGKTGIEQHYEFELHGKSGHEQIEVDSTGRSVRLIDRTAPNPGNDLVLTIDAKLQEVAEKAFGERRGALVAIEPATGGVLALVSMPTFDPNLFVDGISSVDWDELNTSLEKPMVNRALNGAYPPGSTFKPFMALGALTLGKRTPQQRISDPGYFNLGSHRFMDDKAGGHGMVDLHTSIVVSCNTYYYTLANDMGIDAISGFMRELGLGQRTGLDVGLDNGAESDGVLPSKEWKKKRFSTADQQKWHPGETISVGIGQGYNAYTPIQMAQAVATIANDGVMMRPHLVQRIVDGRSGEERKMAGKTVRTLKVAKEHLALVRKAMVDVNKEGTAARSFHNAAYESGGKTGTAQVYSLRGEKYVHGEVDERMRDHSWFVAFAPAREPKIALAILVENGGFGAQSAAPIARLVLDYYLLGKLPAGAAPEETRVVEELPLPTEVSPGERRAP